MPKIHFEKRMVIAKIRNPLKDFQVTEEEIEVRTDPLLRYTTRVLTPKGLDIVPEVDPLPEFVKQSKPCFFCEGRVETQTPMLPEDVHEPGRIQKGEALLFPNLSGYGKYSGVCILSREHFTPLESFSEEQVFDALRACQEYFQVCGKSDGEILYPTVNWNYLLPAGSSLLHPHLQPILDPVPTGFHSRLIDESKIYADHHGSRFWSDFLDAEKDGPRFLYETEHTFWFTPFAPLGFNEINGIIGKGESFESLEKEIATELATGIVSTLRFYHHIKHNSFNLTIFFPSLSCDESESPMPCLVKIATRPVFTPHYRNDVTFFERFHQESVIDQTPEDVASAYLGFMAKK